MASPCTDGSAILVNPAALAFQQGVLGVGVAGIRNASTFSGLFAARASAKTSRSF